MTYYKDVMDRIQEYQPELVTKHRNKRRIISKTAPKRNARAKQSRV